MRFTYKGKTYTIPDKEIKTAMEKLNLTKAQAIKMWLEDNEIEVNQEQADLTAKAKDNGVAKDMTRCKSAKKVARKREPKQDITKENIIKAIAEIVAGIGENVQIENPSKIVTFTIGEEHYTVNLVRNRQKK